MRSARILLTLAPLLLIACETRSPPREERHREVEELKRRVEETDDLIADHEKRIKHMEKYIGDWARPPDWNSMPPITGEVTGVSEEYRAVRLSVGSDDNVEVGYEFTIFRGDEYVGKVIIDSVEQDWSSGHSKKEVERLPIQVGDAAKTRF